MTRILRLAAILTTLTACSGDDRADTQTIPPAQRTFAIFSPAANALPIPNDLLFASNPVADGTMFAGNDTANPVIQAIDELDGASLIAPIDIAFSDSLSTPQSLDARSFI